MQHLQFLGTLTLLILVLSSGWALQGKGAELMAEEFYTNNFELEEQWSDYGIGDPYVLRYNGRYYLYPSTKDGFPGVRVWVSEDLVNWSYAGYATEEPVTTTAYAPEVVYSNGKFYMYTSPAGNGHYVLTSNSPLGPFELQTDNFGMTIDGSVFIDDDGQWYFTHAGTQGIIGHAMHDPLNVSPAGRTLNAYLGHWTEGSTIFKREGTYYMTYTGNHVFSPGYRINYSFATDEPLGSYITPRNNPIIINTTDNFFGLGHNSIVLGPNLDAYYIVYHNLVGRSMAGPPVRKMNIDRMAFNGKKLVVLGPTYFPQPVPELPDYFTWIDEEGWNEWLIYERDQQILALSPAVSEPRFTTEYNLCLHPEAATGQVGVVFSCVDPDNYWSATIDLSSRELQVCRTADGIQTVIATTELLPSIDLTALQAFRVISNEQGISVFISDLLTLEVPVQSGAGRFGYIYSKNLNPLFSFTAMSNHARQSSDKTAVKPIPGQIEAMHYADAHLPADTTLRTRPTDEYSEALEFTAGISVEYPVNVRASGLYAVDAVVDPSTSGTLTLYLDDKPQATFTIAGGKREYDWVKARLGVVHLDAGIHKMTVKSLAGNVVVSYLDIYPTQVQQFAYTNDLTSGVTEEWNSYGVWNWMSTSQGFSVPETDDNFILTGSTAWRDYAVEVDVVFTEAERLNDAGIMLRITNPSYHHAQVADAAMGYYVSVNSRQLTLSKLNYGVEILGIKRISIEPGRPYRLRVEAQGSDIRVFFDGSSEPILEYYDPDAFMFGQVGLRSKKTNAFFRNFSVKTLSDEIE